MRRAAAFLLALLLTLAGAQMGAGAQAPARAPSGPGAPAAPWDGCAAAPVDLVLVLDDSGSMAEPDGGRPPSDPDGLRGTAAHLLLDILGPADRAGVVVFSTGVRTTPLQAAGAATAALHGAVALRGRGETDLAGGLEAALAQLAAARAPGRRQGILLLTDGQPEVTGQPEQGRADQERRLLAAARRAWEEGVRLYAVGLGAGADLDLLKRLGQESRSPLARAVAAPAQLPAAFLDMLLDLKGLNSLGGGPALEILPYTRAVSFLVLRPAGAPGLSGLRPPPGEPQPPVQARDWPGLAFGYDVVTVDGPAAGSWGAGTAPGAVLWAVADLALDLQVLEPPQRDPVAAGVPVPVRLRLLPCAGAPAPGSGSVTAQVTAAREDRAAAGAPFALAPDGPDQLAGAVLLPEPGEYVLRFQVSLLDRPVAAREVTVPVTDQARFRLTVPARGWTLAPLPVVLLHEQGGRQTPVAAVPPVVARQEGCPDAFLSLAPEGVGRWAGTWVNACRRPGRVVFTAGDGEARAAAEVLPTPLVLLAEPGPLKWSWSDALLGRPRALRLRLRAPHPLPPGSEPTVTLAGAPVRVASARWQPDPAQAGTYTLDLSLVPDGQPAGLWRSLAARAELRFAAPDGTPLDAPPVALAVRFSSPAAAVGNGALGAVAAALAALAWQLRQPRPRGRLGASGAPAARTVDLERRALGRRLLRPSSVTVGSPGTGAELVAWFLPPGVTVTVTASRGPGPALFAEFAYARPGVLGPAGGALADGRSFVLQDGQRRVEVWYAAPDSG